jgi:hypothetical protein
VFRVIYLRTCFLSRFSFVEKGSQVGWKTA